VKHAIAIGAVCVTLAGSVQASGAQRVIDPRTSTGDAPRSDADLRQAMLDSHNAARAALGEQPLTWDDRLSADAQTYADTLARTHRFQHETQPVDSSREGENLFTGTRGAYTYGEMVGLWIAERRDFVPAVTPHFSRTGNPEVVAHYTQIVWRNTTRLGCALASNSTDDYLVCRYSPPGNVIGERAF
jgi:uncharacterized protein YkwD